MIRLPGTGELLLILIIVIILFGASRFASLGTAIGRTVREVQNIPRVAREDMPPDEPEILDVEQMEGLRSSLWMLLNPRNLLLRLVKLMLFRWR